MAESVEKPAMAYGWRWLLYWAATIAGIAYILSAFLPVPFGPDVDFFSDLHAYWALDLSDLYGRPVGARDAFVYSPAAALTLWPLTLVPFSLVAAAWVAGSVALVLWLRAGPLLVIWPFPDPILVGNVSILYAAVIVVGMRMPGAWAFIALTKVTPAVGALWYAARGEWRRFGTAVGVSVLLAAASFLVLPEAWFEWWALLVDNVGADTARGDSFPVPLAPRLLLALILTLYAARADWAWLLPVVVLLASPVLWFSTFAVLMAVPRLWQQWAAHRGRAW